MRAAQTDAPWSTLVLLLAERRSPLVDTARRCMSGIPRSSCCPPTGGWPPVRMRQTALRCVGAGVHAEAGVDHQLDDEIAYLAKRHCHMRV